MKQNQTQVIGLTGPMGAGKSMVSNVFKTCDIPVVDVDVIVSELYGEELFCLEIDEEWDDFSIIKGEDVKPQVAAMIAQHPERLPRLEEISKEWVETAIQAEINEALERNSFVVLDAPLLFEAGWNEWCDYIILVTASDESRRERVMKRPGMTEEKMNVLMARQLPVDDENRISNSTWIIENEGEKSVTIDRANILALELAGKYQ